MPNHGERLLARWQAPPLPPKFNWAGNYWTIILQKIFPKHWLAIAALIAMPLAALPAICASNSYRTLGGWNTDHFSHMMAVLAFFEVGPKIYSVPIREFCSDNNSPAVQVFLRRYRLEEYHKSMACQIPGMNSSTALFINWPNYPRLYPLGSQVYHLLEALLYRAGMPFSTVNILIIWKYAFVSLLLVAFLIRHGIRMLYPRENSGIGAMIIFLTGSSVIGWSLTGVYDGVSVLFLFLSALWLLEKRFDTSLLAWSLAFFCHYRALWYFPIAAVCVLELLRSGGGGRSSLIKIAASGWCSAIAFISLFSSRSAITEMPVNNPWYWDRVFSDPTFIGFFLLTAALMACALFNRNWLRFMVAASIFVFFVATREVRPWHMLFLWPMLYLDLFARQSILSIARLEALLSLIWLLYVSIALLIHTHS